MESRQCELGKHCLVHGFQGRCAELLVNRAFSLIVDKNFSMSDQQRFWLVSRGKL